MAAKKKGETGGRDGLTLKQRKFLLAYLGEADGNASEAARIAGYAEHAVQGHDNLRNPKIRAAIDAHLDEAAMGSKEVLARLTEHARGSLGDFIDVTGPMFTLNLGKAKTANKLRLLKKLKEGKYGVEIELHDPQAALEKLGRYHGLFRDRVEHSGPPSEFVPITVVEVHHPAPKSEND